MSELGLVLLTVASGTCLTAMFLGLAALFPRRFNRTLRSAEDAPGRSFLVGLVNLLFFGAVGLGFAAISNGLGTPILMLPGLAILAVLTGAMVVGLASLSGLVGERTAPGDPATRQRIVGAVILILGSLTPFLGWFLLFPYLCVVALGAFILGWFRPPVDETNDETLPIDPDRIEA